jgi:hypothetical protein
MANKKVRDEDEDFEEIDETTNQAPAPEAENEEEDNFEEGGDSFIDDDDDLDIVIEIDEDDLDFEEKKPATEDEDIVLSKHKMEGKHSLKYDSIFKGKKDTPMDEDELDGFAYYYKDSIEVDKSSSYYFESIDNESYVRSKLVKERVYQTLCDQTELNFMNNRRKPSRSDFNSYYNLLKVHLDEESFTNVELFNELAVYFSDNLFNMFKLLDNKWRNIIINELQDHIGKTHNSKEVMNRNIYEGTEIEFVQDDGTGNGVSITGVVLETYYDDSEFKVDSYERIYFVHISEITQILNNTKFKNNLNKLNNIDFL